jgi:hypothetical protein
MALNDPNQDPFEVADLQGALKNLANHLVSVETIERLWKGSEPSAVKLIEITIGVLLSLLGTIGAQLAKSMIAAEDIADPAFRRLASAALKDITGVDVSLQPGVGQGDSRQQAARTVGAGILKALTGISSGGVGAGSVLQPTTKPAEDYLSFVVNMAMEGWLTDITGELMTLGAVEQLGDLDDALSSALGLARTSRAVMRPFMNATVTTPATWQINKTYRPELLAVGAAVRQYRRGRWTREQLDEELARQGWSADRIDAHINEQRKFFSAGDVRTFVDRDHWSMDTGLQHLRDQGYDENAAVDAIRLEGLRRIDQLEAAEASAIIAAFVDRRIAGGEMRALLRTAVRNNEERALLEELAEVRLAVNVKHLSPGEARAGVKAGVLAIVDYRRALERDGYVSDAVIALELLLLHELDEKRDIEELRAQQAAERAAEKKRRDDAAAIRKAEIEAERAERRRGPIADLERAVIRGLIPMGRLVEVLAADYDADTVDILISLVEEDRLRHLGQQQAAADARQRAGRRDLDVGSLERAVMAGLLTPEEFRARLDFLKFTAADAALLTAVVRAKKVDQDTAIAKRRDAEERARRRRIDLSRFERLVRRGARSMAEYDALLQNLGFEDADRAAMRQLLELVIADDRAADVAARAAEPELAARGLSLDQFRRAVVLGISTEDAYQRFLIDQNFTADAQAVLLAELRLAVADADDARRKREQPAPAPPTRGLPLATLQRAARLGVITPDTYVVRLQALGYTPDDIAIEFELLVIEIAETQAARQQRAAAEPEAGARGLSLAQVERAVRAGALTLDDYRAAAIGAGMSGEAVDVVAAVLAQEVGTLTEARELRTVVLRQLSEQNVSLEELEKTVTKGGQSIDTFIAELAQRGVGEDEAELVAALLVDELEAAAPQG